MGIREQIIRDLLGTGRDGIDDLINWMDLNGFFIAPCSGAYHLACEGGLAEHSLNVLNTMEQLAYAFGEPLSDAMTISALLHDLGKVGQFGKPNYVPNMLKTGQSKAKPYKTNPNLLYEEHEVRSVIIASKFIDLTEEEQGAILHHNGLFGKLDSAYGNTGFDKTKLAFLLHTADMWCCRFKEVEKGGETSGES